MSEEDESSIPCLGSSTVLEESIVPRRFGHQAFAGAFSGFVNTIVFSPLDVLKTRMQAKYARIAWQSYDECRGRGRMQQNPYILLREMLRQEGAMSFYRGLSASLWAMVPNWTIHWTVYEMMKERLTTKDRNKSAVHCVSAVCAGAVTSIATSPFWVVKTRMQLEVSDGRGQRGPRLVGRETKSLFGGRLNMVSEESISQFCPA